MPGLEGDLESLKICVNFQAGQIEMTAGEVQALSPGVILPIDRGPSDFLDVIANGKRIGYAELVMVGDKLAVRVTRLSTDA